MDNDNVNLSFCTTCKVWLNFTSISSDKKLNSKVPEHLFEMEHCALCHRIWDGNAQCPC